jgi:DNA gyrase subunit A
MGRATQGVRGIKLKKGDVVVSLSVIAAAHLDDAELLAVTECGFGKRTFLREYPVQGRGGQGVVTLKVTSKTGALASLGSVRGDEELLVLSEGGVLIRTRVGEVSRYGRSSQGVTIMRLGAGGPGGLGDGDARGGDPGAGRRRGRRGAARLKA